MTVKSTPAKGRRGGGARAGLGQGIGGASGGQVVKEGTPELKKVRSDITRVVKKKTRGGIVGARSKTTPKTGKPVPLTSEFQVRDMLLYKGGGYPHWPVQVSLVHDDKLDVVYCGTGETGTISKSGLSNILPFNEENILKLRLDSNKRLAKALLYRPPGTTCDITVIKPSYSVPLQFVEMFITGNIQYCNTFCLCLVSFNQFPIL